MGTRGGGEHKTDRASFQRFLIGNGLSILISLVGASIIFIKNIYYLVLLISLSIILYITLKCWYEFIEASPSNYIGSTKKSKLNKGLICSIIGTFLIGFFGLPITYLEIFVVQWGWPTLSHQIIRQIFSWLGLILTFTGFYIQLKKTKE